MKKFTNRPNELITTTDGRKLFHSRSIAVVPQILCFIPEPYILLNQRGPGCPDEVGKWGLPCGYLDWDETAIEAVFREVLEECALDITDKTQVRSFSDQPWKVMSDPTRDPKQNVTLHYGIKITVPPGITLPLVSNKNDENDEVADVAWMLVSQATQMDLAFGHQRYIREFENQDFKRI